MKREKRSQLHQLKHLYNIITKQHLNCFANGILTSCRLNNMYPIENMKFVKDNRKLLRLEDKEVFDKSPSFKLSSHDTHKAINHTRNNKQKKGKN